LATTENLQHIQYIIQPLSHRPGGGGDNPFCIRYTDNSKTLA